MSRKDGAGGIADVDRDGETRLVEQVRAGADWALGALIARYQPLLVRYLARLTGYSEGLAPLVEEIFVRMERRIQGPRGGDHLRLWLLRAATDDGLDVLRHPFVRRGLRLPTMRVAGLIAGPGATSSPSTTRSLRNVSSHQTRPLAFAQRSLGSAETLTLEVEPVDPKDVLRHRLTRSVLAELPLEDSRAMALHLVAALNTLEVANALGLAPTVARARVVAGLRDFGARYERLISAMGIPRDLAYGNASPFDSEGEYPGYLGPLTLEPAPASEDIDRIRVVDALPVYDEQDAPAVPVSRTETFAPMVPVQSELASKPPRDEE
jgi:DNA-directed RNA polymerase specialized sigma24 family protein